MIYITNFIWSGKFDNIGAVSNNLKRSSFENQLREINVIEKQKLFPCFVLAQSMHGTIFPRLLIITLVSRKKKYTLLFCRQ